MVTTGRERTPVASMFGRLLAPVLLLVALSSSGVVAAQTSTQSLLVANDLGLPELVIVATEEGWDAPETIEAGRYLLTVTYNGEREFATTAFARLPDDWTIDDFNQRLSDTFASFGISPEPGATSTGPDLVWLYDLTLAGGVSPTPGTTEQAIIDLPPGNWVIWADDFVPAARSLTVTGDLPAVRPIPPQSATITGVNVDNEFRFNIEGDMLAGQQIVEIVNETRLPIYVEFLRLSEPVSVDQLRAFLITPEGLAPDPALEVPADFSASLTPYYSAMQSPQTTQWMVSNFEPGSWGMVCWLPDPETNGASLVSQGMIATFDVQ